MWLQMLSFKVRAVADDNKRVSEATVTVHIQDINDNSPTFSQEVLSIENLSILVGKLFVLPLTLWHQNFILNFSTLCI
jgi:hypothetical protein